MICYKDMTFCSQECDNMKCSRNLSHIPRNEDGTFNVDWPIAVAEFSDCDKRGGKE
jgi:hypothetical protein